MPKVNTKSRKRILKSTSKKTLAEKRSAPKNTISAKTIKKKVTAKKVIAKKAPLKRKMAFTELKEVGVANTDEPNFKYSMTITGVSIQLLDINGTEVQDISAEDKIFADKDTPFYIEIQANLDQPTGSGSFQLFDLDKNKNVFDEAQELKFKDSGSGGLFLKNVTLP